MSHEVTPRDFGCELDDEIFDKFHEECGVFGVFGHPNAAELTYFALVALQHRGQESAGIATVDGVKLYHHKGMGLVSDAIPKDTLPRLSKGHASIGHVRYSTTGVSQLINAQPLVFNFQRGNLALAHNGNLTNALQLHGFLERRGAIFQSTSDTEVMAHLIARAGNQEMEANIREALSIVKGAYAFVILTDDKMFAMRDPNGLRPMVLGKIGDAYCVASESCAFDTIGAELIRDVEPGEMLIISAEGVESTRFSSAGKQSLCTFEYIYFARPDSDIDGYNVHMVRKEFGRQLYREAPVEADVVIGVPDSSISSAIGYAEAAHLPYEIGLIKNRYIGRTFIQPSQELRAQGVKLKLSAVRKIVEGKRVIMIDDSIVRGTTSGRIVSMLRDAGATEVHVLIASPPVTHSCFYGIDTSSRDELIAANKTVPQIREYIGADSLSFLSEEGMMKAFGFDGSGDHGHCNACFTGRYPVEIHEEFTKSHFER
ncbi:amidophosphoribosyltransferase [Tumebacillus sp. DT12]|uniref:Amidophosphoribosyltransferase n=1 Tax=Tumebacillus lacus TaxID=2995335 RepID=A0ABT3X8Z1_9BACL|nr:amidophosphoribosyltransferase [Tumebacillus lacus]MCX7572080.1 amidophosphoribosyltransferase [Tumebacillus lacus]